jgi:hypothetical protein
MNDRFKIGAFGYFEFNMRKKNKRGDFINPISGYYEIIDIDEKNIEITDQELKAEGRSIIVTKRRVKVFELC